MQNSAKVNKPRIEFVQSVAYSLSQQTIGVWVLTLAVILPTVSLSQQRGQQAAPAKPTPRHPDGRPNFGPPPGETGLWQPAGSRLADVDHYDPKDPKAAFNVPDGFPGKLKLSDVPFQPWARALFDYRQDNEFEPYTRCKPSGGPRQVATAYGTELIDMPDLKRLYITQTGGPHTFRIVYMDGRAHPDHLDPSYYGHSVGHWEADTIVVDTIGFNEKFWMDREGTPHTEKLHIIERFTRTDFNTLKYEVTIDDPGAYTSTWKAGFFFRWQSGVETFEYICQDNNQAPELLVGSQKSVDRSSLIVP